METTEKLSHGMYCEVTREQAVELLTIEAGRQHSYVESYVNNFTFPTIVWWSEGEVVISGINHGYHTDKLPFPDFKDRLVNTVKG